MVPLANSVREMLRADMECEGILECFHGLKEINKEEFQVRNGRQEPLTVDEIADSVDRKRSTAYRSVQRLLTPGFIQKEHANYEQGGFHHVYHPRDAEDIAREMQRRLYDWYAKMGQLIGEFSEKYDDEPTVSAEP